MAGLQTLVIQPEGGDKVYLVPFVYTRFKLLKAERLARSPPTKANRFQPPAWSPDFCKWESMPLVGGFSRGYPVSPAPSFRRHSIFTSITLIGSQELDPYINVVDVRDVRYYIPAHCYARHVQAQMLRTQIRSDYIPAHCYARRVQAQMLRGPVLRTQIHSDYIPAHCYARRVQAQMLRGPVLRTQIHPDVSASILEPAQVELLVLFSQQLELFSQYSHGEKEPAPNDISEIDPNRIICWKTFPVDEGKLDNTGIISVFGNASMYLRKKMKMDLGDQIWLYGELVGTTASMDILGHGISVKVCKNETGNRDRTMESFEIGNMWSAKPPKGDIGANMTSTNTVPLSGYLLTVNMYTFTGSTVEEHSTRGPELIYHLVPHNSCSKTTNLNASMTMAWEILLNPFKYPTHAAYLITVSYNSGNQAHVYLYGMELVREISQAMDSLSSAAPWKCSVIADSHAEVRRCIVILQPHSLSNSQGYVLQQLRQNMLHELQVLWHCRDDRSTFWMVEQLSEELGNVLKRVAGRRLDARLLSRCCEEKGFWLKRDIQGDSSPFLLQPFHELSNGFWSRLTSPHPAIQFIPKMFYRVEIGALGGPVQSANIVNRFPLLQCPVATVQTPPESPSFIACRDKGLMYSCSSEISKSVFLCTQRSNGNQYSCCCMKLMSDVLRFLSVKIGGHPERTALALCPSTFHLRRTNATVELGLFTFHAIARLDRLLRWQPTITPLSKSDSLYLKVAAYFNCVSFTNTSYNTPEPSVTYLDDVAVRDILLEGHRRQREYIRGRGKWEIRPKTHRPAASSSTIPTCENQGVIRPWIEPGYALAGDEQSNSSATVGPWAVKFCCSENLHVISVAYALPTDNMGCCGVVVRLLASHRYEPGSISGQVTPGFLHVGIVPDRRVFSGICHFPRSFITSPLYPPRFTLIGFQVLDFKRHPTLFTQPTDSRQCADPLRLARLFPPSSCMQLFSAFESTKCVISKADSCSLTTCLITSKRKALNCRAVVPSATRMDVTSSCVLVYLWHANKGNRSSHFTAVCMSTVRFCACSGTGLYCCLPAYLLSRSHRPFAFYLGFDGIWSGVVESSNLRIQPSDLLPVYHMPGRIATCSARLLFWTPDQGRGLLWAGVGRGVVEVKCRPPCTCVAELCRDGRVWGKVNRESCACMLVPAIASGCISHLGSAMPHSTTHDQSSCLLPINSLPYSRYLVLATSRTEAMMPLLCCFCGKAFATLCSVYRHEITTCKINSSTVTFDCKFCQKQFSRSDNLKRHYKICNIYSMQTAPLPEAIPQTAPHPETTPHISPQLAAHIAPHLPTNPAPHSETTPQTTLQLAPQSSPTAQHLIFPAPHTVFPQKSRYVNSGMKSNSISDTPASVKSSSSNLRYNILVIAFAGRLTDAWIVNDRINHDAYFEFFSDGCHNIVSPIICQQHNWQHHTTNDVHLLAVCNLYNSFLQHLQLFATLNIRDAKNFQTSLGTKASRVDDLLQAWFAGEGLGGEKRDLACIHTARQNASQSCAVRIYFTAHWDLVVYRKTSVLPYAWLRTCSDAIKNTQPFYNPVYFPACVAVHAPAAGARKAPAYLELFSTFEARSAGAIRTTLSLASVGSEPKARQQSPGFRAATRRYPSSPGMTRSAILEWSGAGAQGGGNRSHRQAASSSTIPTRENPEVNPPGIEPVSPWWEASALATAPPLQQSYAQACNVLVALRVPMGHSAGIEGDARSRLGGLVTPARWISDSEPE
ncbi:hypothetical protein PR048_004467 [Dryococelus australis]|uniref:C2H2-type domain-containing protein n=1 Tax=Dryococelus australis TaxID=614101 RepID=A0ABQ9I5J2_9NEOP|nr:hypothetical protein PR048_004467 [Dryococelus australis]